VRRIVNRQTTAAVRIDVCKGAVGKLRALLRTQPWHAGMFAWTIGPEPLWLPDKLGGRVPSFNHGGSGVTARVP
jgi:hypothetical protein